MYDPNALPPPPGMFTIMGAPGMAPQGRPGSVPNALAPVSRSPGSAYGGAPARGGGMPAMPPMPAGMPVGAGRPMMPGYNTGVVPPGLPNSYVPPSMPGMPPVPGATPGLPGTRPEGTFGAGLANAPGAMGGWFQQFMGPNGFDMAAFRAAMDAWRTQRQDWREARPEDRSGISDWRSSRPLPPWRAPATAAATTPADIAAAQAIPPVPVAGYDPFGG